MGQRLRLKAAFQIPTNSTVHEAAVFRALKKYGAIVADNGGNVQRLRHVIGLDLEGLSDEVGLWSGRMQTVLVVLLFRGDLLIEAPELVQEIAALARITGELFQVVLYFIALLIQ